MYPFEFGRSSKQPLRLRSTCAGLLVLGCMCVFAQGRKTNVQLSADAAQTASELMYGAWDFDAAKKELDRALRLDPKNARARVDLAWYHLLYNRSTQAISEMKIALQDAPSDPLWPTWLGWAYVWLGEAASAEKAVNQALAIDPSYAEAFHVKSKIYVVRGDFDTAITLHRKAASLDPTMWTYGLAHTLALAGHTKEARELLNALEDNQWNSLGKVKIHLALGEHAKARQALQQAYDLRHPYFPWIAQDTDLQELWDTSLFKELLGKLDL